MCNKSFQSIRDEIVQTEYDPGFEQWYRQSYSNKFNEKPNHTESKTVTNERKTVQTLFMRGKLNFLSNSKTSKTTNEF